MNGSTAKEDPVKPGAGLFPLVLYLHSAALTKFVNGDVQCRQLRYLAEESPQSVILRGTAKGRFDSFIGLSPCCPPNLSCFDRSGSGKGSKMRKVFWFKTCDDEAYNKWDFRSSERCLDVEVLVVELLHRVCIDLPIDLQRIYFLGSSCGGYAVLRLAELVPDVPACVLPFAGYYPDMPDEDHTIQELANRLQYTQVWPFHCRDDEICRLDNPMVQNLYKILGEQKGLSVETFVEWVDKSVAKGSQSSCHSAINSFVKKPDFFFPIAVELLSNRYSANQVTRYCFISWLSLG